MDKNPQKSFKNWLSCSFFVDIPWLTDRDEYLQKNVAPYSPGFVVDEKKTRIGYEIPFTREFYKYTPLKPSADIFEELKVLEQQEAEIMNKLLH